MKEKISIEKILVGQIKINPKNPRNITPGNFEKLVKSIREFPEMLELRPIIIDENNIALGGNMRLKACIEADLLEVPTIRISNLTEQQKKEFILKDNQAFGEWDHQMLQDWDKEMLLNSGFEQWDLIDIFGTNEMEDRYTANIDGSNFNPEIIDVNDYIKQNILFFNEFMIEFEDDEVKKAIHTIKNDSNNQNFVSELKELILRYGENSI